MSLIKSSLYVEDEKSDDEEAFFIHTIRSLTSEPALVTYTFNNYHKVTDMGPLAISCHWLTISRPKDTKNVHNKPNQNPPYYAQQFQGNTNGKSYAAGKTKWPDT